MQIQNSLLTINADYPQWLKDKFEAHNVAIWEADRKHEAKDRTLTVRPDGGFYVVLPRFNALVEVVEVSGGKWYVKEACDNPRVWGYYSTLELFKKAHNLK